MVKSKENAKRKYLAKTTGDRWESGAKDGIPRWAAKTGEYYDGITVGPESRRNFEDGINGGRAEYERNTDDAAADRMFNNAKRGLSR